MCGIVGIMPALARPKEELAEDVRQMANTLLHRGPDAGAVWCSSGGVVGLGHRRLAIVDLSSNGAQPMASRSGRFVVTFNGEIYNHAKLRADLAQSGYEFQGHSDTEVLVSALEHWGIERTLKALTGMFSFAAWDEVDQALYLARDRLGEKPLYYGRVGGDWVFASELKAISSHPRWKPEISLESVSLYLRYGYVPGPHCIYKGLYKLLPGSYIRIPPVAHGSVAAFSPAPERKAELMPRYYWDLFDHAERGLAAPRTDALGVVSDLDELLRSAVQDQMLADVPLGAFLSGGVDSSTVVSVMQALSETPVKTFTIGFDEAAFNEAEHARAIAAHLGTHHEDLYVTPAMALELVPQLPVIWDEPFADASQLPTLLLSGLAKQHVTVCLTGDGGDELFCGYNRYLFFDDVSKRLARYPEMMRKAAAVVVDAVPSSAVFTLYRALAVLYPKLRSVNAVDLRGKIAKLVATMESSGIEDLYRALISYWRQPERVMRNAVEAPFEYLGGVPLLCGLDSSVDQLMAWDLKSYLPDDNLVKVDRASMAHSLETRLPLLDHRIVELALSTPASIKVRNGISKWPLRQVLYKYVPKELIERPKMGFSVPIGEWLKGELKCWAEELLSDESLDASAVFDSKAVQQQWTAHQSGREDNSSQLWTLLMFQAWFFSQEKSKSSIVQ